MRKGIFVLLPFANMAYAGTPIWSFSPNASPVISVTASSTASLSYTITNHSKKPHQLVLSSNTPQGISQVGGACVLAGRNASNPAPTCTLTLNINGSALPADNISGGPILCQSNSNGSPNLMQCYQPSTGDTLVITRTNAPGATTLSASTSNLALSVNDPSVNAALVGNPRQITITNTGSNPASDLNISYPTWPTGTTATSTCGASLAPGSSCTITVTPGVNATSGCNTAHIAPTPGVISVSASNVSTPVTSNVVVLSYSCIYQGGYVYAVDDTTPITGSIGGKVATTTDQAAPGPNGIIWSSNGGTNGGSGGNNQPDTSYDNIPGIDHLSTSISGSPSYTDFSTFFSNNYTNPSPFTSASFSQCDGISDGSCNTNNVLTFYNQFITNNTIASGTGGPFTASTGPTNITSYAAGLCKQTISGFSDWYLPAICEMGYQISAGSGCGSSSSPLLQNMQQSLIDISGLSTPSGTYWSSTEAQGPSQSHAWFQVFGSSGMDQNGYEKYGMYGVRCSRALIL